jgi:stage II sporulation protein GA (sporulation sigma-E factor processing peptidase)
MMEAKIYIDILFLINLCMNYFLLWMTSILAKRRKKLLHLFGSSMMISIIYCLPFFFERMKWVHSPFGAMVLLWIGVKIAFCPKGWREFCNLFCMTAIVSLAIGGICMAFFFAKGYGDMLGRGITTTIRHFPFKILIATTSICYVGIKCFQGWLEAHMINQKDYCTTIVRVKGKEITMQMLIDTGNGLKDPFTGNDVVIASFSAMQELFSRETKRIFLQKTMNESELAEYILQEEREIPFRFIPFSSVGKKHGLLLTFRPEQVTIITAKKKVERTDVMVGIYDGQFSGYCGLVNPDTIQNT